MNEIKELLEAWKTNGFANPDSLEKLYQAILLIIDQMEKTKK